ncbi:MAG TPA: DegT/DnrJ/EryC1/StrS family aminotransferase [Candidatus Dormibacteraeota bacterium]|nr:DegT/DnrJ/EryC1/StrS family aminotransferase [Candidatus Dormibacteraeota bacterium]
MSELALLGGGKAKRKPFPVWPQYDDNERRVLQEVLESRVWWRTPGTKTLEFEKAFARYHGARHGIAVTNGTAALEVTMEALGVGPGDEVIVPDFTFIATASAVLFANALPVLVDVDPETYCLDPALTEAAITPRTKAIIAVHMGGHPADLDRLQDLARKHGIALVEDSAHAHGSEWRGRKIGTFGTAATFSFQSSKLMTAGEGGIIISNDDAFERQARSVHDCGRMPGEWFYSHFIYGSNYRLSEWQGAILKVQLGRLEPQTLQRHRNGRLLDKLLADIPGITSQTCDPRCTRNGQYAYIFHVDAKQFAGISTENVIAALNAEGIPTQASYPPLHELDCFCSGEYRKCLSGAQATEKHAFLEQAFPHTQRAAWGTVWIPQFALLGDEEDMNEIAEGLRKIQRNATEIAANTSQATAERVAR